MDRRQQRLAGRANAAIEEDLVRNGDDYFLRVIRAGARGIDATGEDEFMEGDLDGRNRVNPALVATIKTLLLWMASIMLGALDHLGEFDPFKEMVRVALIDVATSTKAYLENLLPGLVEYAREEAPTWEQRMRKRLNAVAKVVVTLKRTVARIVTSVTGTGRRNGRNGRNPPQEAVVAPSHKLFVGLVGFDRPGGRLFFGSVKTIVTSYSFNNVNDFPTQRGFIQYDTYRTQLEQLLAAAEASFNENVPLPTGWENQDVTITEEEARVTMKACQCLAELYLGLVAFIDAHTPSATAFFMDSLGATSMTLGEDNDRGGLSQFVYAFTGVQETCGALAHVIDLYMNTVGRRGIEPGQVKLDSEDYQDYEGLLQTLYEEDNEFHLAHTPWRRILKFPMLDTGRPTMEVMLETFEQHHEA